jgi:hypothetical protein
MHAAYQMGGATWRRRGPIVGSLAAFALALYACSPRGGATEGSTSASACPAAWLEAPAVDPSIAVPGGDGRVVFHAAAEGTQIYSCATVATVVADGGAAYAWSLVGPEAVLKDCRSEASGRHFASDAGPGAPEWQLTGGAYVVAHKVAAKIVAPDSVPWLLLSADRSGGSGPLTETRAVQRVRTSGGVAPTAGCDASHIGTVQKVPYTADYYFFAP